MAFPLPPSIATIFCQNTSLTSTGCFAPFFTKIFKPQKPSLAKKPMQSFVCKATDNNDQNQDAVGKLDRRNMLIGLGAGGLYGTAGLKTNPSAFAAPVPTPDLATCIPSKEEGGTPIKPIDCCPPKTNKIIDFKLHSPGPLRTRLAAQNAANDPFYLLKYKKAIKLMRDLPHDDPRSLTQQAMVHCAYCDSAYPMAGFPDLEIEVHACWLFFPFHRWFLYFFEKILCKLIDDPTFALPFWNWDAPAGMYMPSIFTDPTSPLYDPYRNAAHQPPKLLDLNFGGKDDCGHCTDDYTRFKENLTTMYRQMISGATSCSLFFGEPYRAGYVQNPGAGTIERIPHNTIHNWTGDPNCNGEDMGNFYSAGRDPIFYAHHSNVDRMWSIYKTRGGKDITDTDWLDTEFLFYDENKNLVRVKVRDSLDESKLGYKYEDVEIPWINSKPTARKSQNKRKAAVSSADLTSKFPGTLSETISVEVRRPSVAKRSNRTKAKEEEVLVISGIEFEGNEMVKFDVYVNDDADVVSRKDKAEFAGSFVHVPRRGKKKIKTNLRLGITKLLEDLGAEEDVSVVVTVVPISGKFTIGGGIKIELIPTTC